MSHYVARGSHHTGWFGAAVPGANDGIISVASLIMLCRSDFM